MPISVLTLNILHDEAGWPARAALIRAWIERLDPDLIGLQEVLRGPGVDQAAELFAGSGRHLAYARAAPFWRQPGLDFGNAVASRWPIAEREELRLPAGGDGETRAALSVRVDSPHGSLGFTCAHLNWRFDHGAIRERQVVALCDLALRRAPRRGFPPVLVGDFNAEPESAEIRYVSGLQSLGGQSVCFRDAWRERGEGEGLTWSSRNPTTRPWLEPDRRIDYVFVGRPLETGVGLVESCRVVCDEPRGGVWPSDHFGVHAKLRTDPIARSCEDPMGERVASGIR